MIDREHDLPITKQAEVLRISRGSVYYLPRPVRGSRFRDHAGKISRHLFVDRNQHRAAVFIEEAWLHADPRQGQLWPDELCVSEPFMRTLLEHAVPLNRFAIRQLSVSALALDVYTWLAHRLCRIRKDGGTPLWWINLREQFGQEYKDERNFKKNSRRRSRRRSRSTLMHASMK
jgi:hypothetical protein